MLLAGKRPLVGTLLLRKVHRLLVRDCLLLKAVLLKIRRMMRSLLLCELVLKSCRSLQVVLARKRADVALYRSWHRLLLSRRQRCRRGITFK